MNTVKQRFVLFCFFIAVIIMGAAILAAKSKNLDMADRGLTLKERIGVDDHSSLAILYGADMQGSLDVCG